MNKNMEELALEIIELQEELENAKKHNKISNLKCNLTKIKAILKIGVAISVVPAAGTVLTLANGWNPYKLNDIEKPMITQTLIDREGNTKQTKGYDLDNKCYLYYYTNWELTNENNYKREIYKYSIKRNDCDKIHDIINNNIEINYNKLNELFNLGTRAPEYEYKAYVSKEELQKGAYIEGVISTADNEDITVVKESVSEHSYLLLIKISIQIIPMIFEFAALGANTYFFENIKEAFDENPDEINEDEIKRKLKAKMLILEKLPLDIERQHKFDEQLSIEQLEKEKTKKLMKML